MRSLCTYLHVSRSQYQIRMVVVRSLHRSLRLASAIQPSDRGLPVGSGRLHQGSRRSSYKSRYCRASSRHNRLHRRLKKLVHTADPFQMNRTNGHRRHDTRTIACPSPADDSYLRRGPTGQLPYS